MKELKELSGEAVLEILEFLHALQTRKDFTNLKKLKVYVGWALLRFPQFLQFL